MHRRKLSLISRSFARMRSARVFRLIWNFPARVLPQMKVKPRKLKVSGLPRPRRLRRSAANRPNSINRVFSGWQRQCKLPQPLAHLIPKALGVALVLEADDEVIGVAHDNHVAGGRVLSPARDPEVEGVVQVDVGEQR